MDYLSPKRYRSDTEFHFREEDAAAIIRSAAYHRRDFPLSVIWISPREHLGIRTSISTSFSRVSNVSLGNIDRLPLELLNEVCLHLDVLSVLKFRHINLRSRRIVDSLHEYQVAISHGLNALCALLRTKLAINVTLLDFYREICTKDCALCGEFGGFIFLPTWIRCCFECLKQAPETQMQTLASIQRRLRLKRQEILQFKSFPTLPGMYTMTESQYKSRVKIVSIKQAMTILERERAHQLLSETQKSNVELSNKFRFMASCALPYFNRCSGIVELGISCAGCQLALEKDIIGSRGERWAYTMRDMVYSQEGFLEHFKWCEQAQLLWTSSEGGIVEPIERPEGVRRGFFNRRE